jgi:hypothetical protein
MGVRVSEKHGVNPTIPLCYFCGKEKGEIALLGKLRGDVEAPRNTVLDMEPCDLCKERRKTHVQLIVLASDQFDEIEDARRRHEEYQSRLRPNKRYPFVPQVDRLGHCFWIDRDKIPQMVQPEELANSILSHGWTFAPVEVTEKLGLEEVRRKAIEEHPDSDEIVCRDVVLDCPEEEDADA